MSAAADDLRRKLIAAAFKMPSVQTMKSRKSSITNAFVNSVIPVVNPTVDEIAEALEILGMEPDAVTCAFCGSPYSEWDHLRPLVLKQRPTGYISEIANLVPACGKCNQSKGNKPWREWMRSTMRLSPTGRNVHDVDARFARLERYEQWRTPTKIDFAEILGQADWDHFWSLWSELNEEMRRCQDVADELRDRVRSALKASQPQ